VTARTVGVEEEVLLVSLQDGTPQPYGDEVVATADTDEDAESGSGIEHELKREQAELDSTPCESLAELSAELLRLRQELSDAAGHHGLGVAPLGTCPVDVRPTPTDDARYLALSEEFGLTARESLSCGCHVHVAVESREEGVAVLDRIRPWLSVVAALSVNSPFWQGEDTGYDSYRTLVWTRWPSAGPTALFGDEAGYAHAVDNLLRSGTILDTGMVYFDARLSAKYPTVEFRVADVCAEVADTVLVAGLCRALVETAAADWRAGLDAPDARPELLRAASWQAARSGLSGDLVDVGTATARPARAVVEGLLDHVRAALEQLGDDQVVAASLERMLQRGTGAQLQRASLARRGRLTDVVLDAVRRSAARQP
jgi:glutamate---cysteine ligase / carboxylate-amine ligase